MPAKVEAELKLTSGDFNKQEVILRRDEEGRWKLNWYRSDSNYETPDVTKLIAAVVAIEVALTEEEVPDGR